MMIFLLLLPLLFGCQEASKERRLSEKKIPVSIAGACQMDVPLELETLGIIAPLLQAEVYPEVSGLLVKTHVREGALVNKGDLLFSIEEGSYRAHFEEMEAERLKSRMSQSFAKSQLMQAERLFKTEAISESELKNYQEKALIAEATLEAIEARLKVAQLNLDSCRIKSPIGGKIGFLSKSEGNLTSPQSKEPLAIIEGLDPLSVAGAIPERYLDLFLKDVEQKECSLFLPSKRGAVFRARIHATDNRVDSKTRMLRFKATLLEKAPLLPGQAVYLKVPLERLEKKTVILKRAVRKDEVGHFVFVIKDQVAHKRKVTLSHSFQDRIIVEEGLALEEQVAVEGQFQLVGGESVEAVPYREGS
ncbi:MAG: efflux transporter periplasmic adaptor subunit [Chlamydiales bacterium]|jgi:RND family efflux transporter MFP subunit|nr:efflux transporter periplasmic adaptor subunit [Chlamydiales bacterium]